MLNLLIVSNNKKSRKIMLALQPMLRTRIDVVSDFDHGLKDVFEKRPSVVIIQQQIAGVSGESVARHIQLLLGNGAPAFIMMHEGDSAVRTVNGLFEYVIDLSKPEKRVVAEIMSALKDILGVQWEKTLITVPEDSAGSSSVPLPEDNISASADLVEAVAAEVSVPELHVSKELDFGSQVEPEFDANLVSAASVSTKLSSEPIKPETVVDSSGMVPDSSGMDLSSSKTVRKKRSTKAVATSDLSSVEINDVLPQQENVPLTVQAQAPEQIKPAFIAVENSAAPVDSSVTPNKNSTVVAAEKQTVSSQIGVKNPSPDTNNETQAELDIVSAFDKNYRACNRSYWLLAAVAVFVILLAAGGWYLFILEPGQMEPPSKNITAESVSFSKSSSAKVALAPPVQSSKPSAMSSDPACLPSFVNVKGRDVSFSSAKPGWERYLDKTHEVRIFRESGRIRALQVIAVKGTTLSANFVDSALHELTGSNRYTVESQAKKNGVFVQRCKVSANRELLLYRKSAAAPVMAFVVALG